MSESQHITLGREKGEKGITEYDHIYANVHSTQNDIGYCRQIEPHVSRANIRDSSYRRRNQLRKGRAMALPLMLTSVKVKPRASDAA